MLCSGFVLSHMSDKISTGQTKSKLVATAVNCVDKQGLCGGVWIVRYHADQLVAARQSRAGTPFHVDRTQAENIAFPVVSKPKVRHLKFTPIVTQQWQSCTDLSMT